MDKNILTKESQCSIKDVKASSDFWPQSGERHRKPLPTQIPLPPPVAPVAHLKKNPSFSTLKNIVMDMDSLNAAQKLELIDKISDLYS